MKLSAIASCSKGSKAMPLHKDRQKPNLPRRNESAAAAADGGGGENGELVCRCRETPRQASQAVALNAGEEAAPPPQIQVGVVSVTWQELRQKGH